MIDLGGFKNFERGLEAAKQDFKPYAGEALKELGEKFMDLVQEAIQGVDNIDTGKLLASFTRGGDGNIWKLDTGGLTLEVGTNVLYAQWVNKGHKQQPGRFVPGYWEGKHFRYVAGAKTGMVLKASFVKGSGFFDKSEAAMQSLLPGLMTSSMEQFFRHYF